MLVTYITAFPGAISSNQRRSIGASGGGRAGNRRRRRLHRVHCHLSVGGKLKIAITIENAEGEKTNRKKIQKKKKALVKGVRRLFSSAIF